MPETPQKILVAVAWPYASGPRHLGHVAGPGVPSDVFARYHRLKGNDVLMVSGTDEHGTPVMVSADREGVTPRELADRNNAAILDDYVRLGMTYDCFTRTTTRNHYTVVQDMFRTLYEKGFLLERTTLGAIAPATGRTLPDRYIEGTCPICGYGEARGDQCDNCGNQLDPVDLIDPRSIVDGSNPEFRETTHLFLDLPAFRERLVEWIEAQTHWRPNVRNFALNLAREVKPRAMTRDIDWGVPVPVEGYPEDTKRIYVWFDAVIGYLSAAIEWAHNVDRPEAWREWWQSPDARSFYFMGKDNIVFHAVIWPSMLMGYGDDLQLPYNVVSSEYLTMSGSKASTSRGHAIWVKDFLDRYEPDALRYYLTAAGPETQDSDFTWEEFVRRTNDELLANWGNLVNRTLVNAQRNFGAVPEPGPLTEGDQALLDAVERAFGDRRRAHRERALQSSSGRGHGDERAGEPVPRRPGAVVAREDRPRPRRHRSLRRAPRRRLAEDALHAVSPLQFAGAARAARLRGLDRRPARNPQRRRGRRLHAQHPHGRLRELGRLLGTEPAAAGPDAARAAAALPQARRGRSPRHRAPVIDTHAHLTSLEDPDEAIQRAAEAGVTRILTVGTSVDDCRRALEVAERHDGVFAILGIHPHEAGTATPDDLAALRELLAHPKAVAVGETGLDWFRDYASPDDQRRLFAAELELAAELGKPVVIHTRAADDDTLGALADHAGTVVLHCFSSPHMLPTALERGWYVSFAGNATYPKAVDLRLAATQVPADRILAETDSPYLAPQPVRGQRNEPANVVHTLVALAQARGEEPAALERQIEENASACFGL